MFDSFYFFHIDKTIGKTMGVHMMDPLYPIMEDHGIKSKHLNINHEAHNYWQDFKENTYIYSTFRDPVERFVSEFLYTTNYTKNGYRKWSGGKDQSSPFANLESFKKWMKEDAIFNYQAKILSSSTFDNDLIKERIKRIDLVIKTESLENNEKNIQNKILNDLKINYNLPYFNKDYELTFYEEATKNFIYNFLNNNLLIGEIQEKNSIDYEIYDYIN
jgi:hypothetical protein